MAQPSSTHRDRERSSSHHHHRTISSTTLLLVLSLILAVLSVMLSIPRTQSTTATGATATDAAPSGILSMFSPRRNQEIIAREATVAEREAIIAKREADLLSGVPGGVNIGTCLPCTVTATMLPAPTEPVTVIREVVKEVESISPPWWKDPDVRVEDVLEREARVSEREKEVARREEVVGKREADASRRETWIIENLMAAEQQPPSPIAQTEEFVTYEDVPRRPSKELPPAHIFTETKTIKNILTETVMIPEPAPTRYAAKPSPAITTTVTEAGAPTTTVEYIEYEEQTQTPTATVTVIRDRMPRAQHAWYSW